MLGLGLSISDLSVQQFLILGLAFNYVTESGDQYVASTKYVTESGVPYVTESGANYVQEQFVNYVTEG